MTAPIVVDAVGIIRMAEQGVVPRASPAESALFAPRILWSECCSVLHRMMRRRGATDGREAQVLDRILDTEITLVDAYDRRAPWEIASILGWHKTYDAEYLAAARHVGAAIWTLDRQLADGARRLGIPIVIPT